MNTPERPYTVTLEGNDSVILWAISQNAAMEEARTMGLNPRAAHPRIHDEE